jgi:hypothetical protein
VPEIPLLMDEAAEKAGFLITGGERSAGQIRVTAPVPGADHHFYIRNANPNICTYSYHRAHAIAFTLEAGFEESTLVRIKRLLEIGGQTWRGERYPGYPADQVGCWTSMALAGWGTTAAQRRASRVELWQKLAQLTFGCAHPEPRGSILAVCATTPAAAKERLEPATVAGLVDKLRGDPHYDGAALADFADRIPAVDLGVQRQGPVPEKWQPIEHGLVIRLLIPYDDAEVSEIRLDGHLIQSSDTDGYQVRRRPGTIVEVAIPPEKVGPLHAVTCFYDSPTPRRAGFLPEDWE